MKEIVNLKTVTFHGKAAPVPLQKIDTDYGLDRIPVLFLVDVSRTMEPYKTAVNDMLNSLISDISHSGDGTQFTVDFAIMTFGNGKIKVSREFDLLLNRNERFQIDTYTGNTPLGGAMLFAYCYAAKRKQMYRDAGLEHCNQPTVVLLSDLREYDFDGSASVDGKEYISYNLSSRQPVLFNEMAELYSYLHTSAYRQFTYFVGIGNVDAANREKLADIASIDSYKHIEEALARVRADFKASWTKRLTDEVMETQLFLSSQDTRNSSLSQWTAVSEARRLESLREDMDFYKNMMSWPPQ